MQFLYWSYTLRMCLSFLLTVLQISSPTFTPYSINDFYHLGIKVGLFKRLVACKIYLGMSSYYILLTVGQQKIVMNVVMCKLC